MLKFVLFCFVWCTADYMTFVWLNVGWFGVRVGFGLGLVISCVCLLVIVSCFWLLGECWVLLLCVILMLLWFAVLSVVWFDLTAWLWGWLVDLGALGFAFSCLILLI